ncbi:exonuclease subunit SbcD [Burkholderia oklahomensis]|uniref:exonuclease subunit SbcD n=1 Tax=Burkholderia oklahomensis TaxID=342113 RepID=UPI00047364D3|nr:exonuclease subunit SbcD [Burkholderia oklahomensis]AJX35639.1 exonuclease SbcCD, D subunit [Burkholderia oklahomensis C6786]AOI49664.1 exonuclease sbcCD subunit D [Burkholderia oklahomensis C6786]KUY55692.1 exonuclease sbcCD subunit D [Burkholderia oklahomensis C6786]MBI0362043.1 exonuclease subunit SbcD [Burkholderia oklahomensis]SUY28993.1 Nuclease sbcCD subunit D [Burkholderia oklahomensis]
MRLLHTSDWHLGQSFMGKSRQAEHQALIDWLMVQVDDHAVDAVVVAGDIFDTGTPPSYARELYSQLVVRLHEAGAALLLLGGNHDSVATLRESSALLERLSASVVPSADAPQNQIRILPLRRADAGRMPGCVVCAIPFIRARDVMRSESGQSAEDKQQLLLHSIQSYYRDTFEAASALRDKLSQETGRRLPLIATGHLTTVGASATESVREIYVGTLDAFPTTAFPPVDYLALGHIHRPQKVGGLEHIRYSGSPIALSFDEASQQKEMLLVDLDESGLRAVTPLPVPAFRRLVSLLGNLTSLADAFPRIAQNATPEHPVWLEVTVAEDDYLSDLPARIQALVEGLPLEVLRIRRDRGNAAAQLTADAGVTLDELDPHDVFARRLEQEDLPEDLRQSLTERYRTIVAASAEDAA